MAIDPKKVATVLANETNSDVLLLNSRMDRGVDTKFIDLCSATCQRDNVIILIITDGGDADVAYRIGRCLQKRYNRITALISGRCKSAGTLLAVAAHEIAFSEHGQLGPLDVQLRKADDVWAATSGFTAMTAFTALQSRSQEAFEEFIGSIKEMTDGNVTFKTASELAANLTVGLYSRVFQQIEVMHVGEAARAINIAREYAHRLGKESSNLDEQGVLRLITDYPSHEFVIDMTEAKEMFKHVRELTPSEEKLCDALGQVCKDWDEDLAEPLVLLSDPASNILKVTDNETAQADRRESEEQESRTQGVSMAPAETATASEAHAQQILRLAISRGTPS
jgi:hypothetical protein